jgi:transposase InsO family protein
MTTRPTELVTVPLRMALWNRRHEGIEIFEGLLHQTDAGAQYVSLKFSEELMLEGILASIGSVGDAYDCQSVLVGLLVDSEDLTSAA